MATLIQKPKSTCSRHLSRNKKLLLMILLVTAVLIIAGVSIHKIHKKFHRLHSEISHTQFLLSRNQRQMNQLNYKDDPKVSTLEQAWRNSESRLFAQEERMRKLEHLLAQRSSQPDMKEANLLQELKAHKEMYLQAQQKIHSYEQQLLALTQEIKSYKDQNQLIRQEQARIRAEHQEILTQKPQVSQEDLKKPLQSRLSQFANKDYELEQKLNDIQRTAESCAKIGELKALEVYYDDKFDSLSNTIKSSSNNNVKTNSNNAPLEQLKQDLVKLNEEKEEMKVAVNNLGEHQRNNEERLKALEKQDRSIEAPVQSLDKVLEEALKNYNVLSQSGQNKKELKEAKKHIKQLHRQINQQPEESHDSVKQNKSQVVQKEQVKVPAKEMVDQYAFERQMGNDLAIILNTVIDLFNDM